MNFYIVKYKNDNIIYNRKLRKNKKNIFLYHFFIFYSGFNSIGGA